MTYVWYQNIFILNLLRDYFIQRNSDLMNREIANSNEFLRDSTSRIADIRTSRVDDLRFLRVLIGLYIVQEFMLVMIYCAGKTIVAFAPDWITDYYLGNITLFIINTQHICIFYIFTEIWTSTIEKLRPSANSPNVAMEGFESVIFARKMMEISSIYTTPTVKMPKRQQRGDLQLSTNFENFDTSTDKLISSSRY